MFLDPKIKWLIKEREMRFNLRPFMFAICLMSASSLIFAEEEAGKANLSQPTPVKKIHKKKAS